MLKQLFERLWRPADREDRARCLRDDASVLAAQGKMTDARVRAEAALALTPENPATLHLLAVIGYGLGDPNAGATYFRRAISIDRRNVDLRMDFGNALRLAGDRDEAELQFREVLRLAPKHLDAYRALGSVLLELGRPKEAKTELRNALAICPDDAGTLRVLAMANFRTFDLVDALACYEQIGDFRLLDLSEQNRLGICLLNTGQFSRARNVLELALAAAPPDSPESLVITTNLAYCHLGAGDWREGFRLLEARHACARVSNDWEKASAGLDWLNFIEKVLADLPRWTAGECRGKRLLIWVEQGRGDTIMLLRLLPSLTAEWGAQETTLLCNESYAAVRPLCQGFPVLCVDSAWRPAPGDFDAHCSIMSLPYLMGLTPDHIPGMPPYIRVTSTLAWRELLRALPGMRVGLVWAGSPVLQLDVLRSVPLKALAPLFEVPGVSFVSLQKGTDAQEEVRNSGLPILDLMENCRDFMETAAFIDNLDLVISVDTAVAHLTGAIGKPVWLLNRYESEWRWMRGREDSVWYPTMKIFNQTAPRDWQPIIGRVADELRSLAARHGGKPGC